MEKLEFYDDSIEIIEELGAIELSNTQNVRIIKISKGGNLYVSIQKWWRKQDSDPWKEGKGFHLTMEQFYKLAEIING